MDEEIGTATLAAENQAGMEHRRFCLRVLKNPTQKKQPHGMHGASHAAAWRACGFAYIFMFMPSFMPPITPPVSVALLM